MHRAFETLAGKSCDQVLSDGCFNEVMSFDIKPCLGLITAGIFHGLPGLYASIELTNGFTELTDAAIQRQRFKAEDRLLER